MRCSGWRKILDRSTTPERCRGYNLQENDSRNWWRIKQLTGMKTRSTHPLAGLANLLYDGNMEALATDINKSFLNVISHLQPPSADAAPPAPDSVPSEFIIDQSSVEIKLSRINTHKAQGPDDLPNWVLRDFSCLAGPVCSIYNASVRDCFFPGRRKEAHIVPAPKIHPPSSIDSDLRPISLIATLGKLLESFV